MNEVLIGKLVDIAFTAAMTKLNRDEVAAGARKIAADGGSVEDVLDWLKAQNESSEDSAQAAIDAM